MKSACYRDPGQYEDTIQRVEMMPVCFWCRSPPVKPACWWCFGHCLVIRLYKLVHLMCGLVSRRNILFSGRVDSCMFSCAQHVGTTTCLEHTDH